MKFNTRENARFALKSSVAVFIVSIILYLLGITYLITETSFEYWWIFLLITIIQTVTSISYCYLAIFKIKIDNYNNNSINLIVLIIIIIEGLTLNIIALLYGIYCYKKVFIQTKIFW